MEDQDNIWHLIAKSLNQEITPLEQAELNRLLREDNGLHQQYELLSRIWQEPHDDAADQEHAERSINKIISKANEQEDQMPAEWYPQRSSRPRRILRKRLMAVGLMVAALVSGWMLFSDSRDRSMDGRTDAAQLLVAQKGSRSRSLLPDGTTVWLNAGSTLQIINDLQGASREVMLEGEGYFDVAKKKGRPFIVHTGGLNIKVLGTVFNVKAYPEDHSIETTLYQGSVNVFAKDQDESKAIHLKPNQKLIIARPGEATADAPAEAKPAALSAGPALPAFSIVPIDSTRSENERIETAWLFSRLEFRGEDFVTLAPKLERWYNIRIVFADEWVKALRFNGSFENETADQAFSALQAAGPPFDYVMKNHEVTIGSRGRK